ncbi:MAG: PCRF domain-containing protein [Planctomycetes bacterium]|nr:PCRF domain-containing protein [Planctomycetota bacterium]
MAEPTFWDNQEKAREVIDESNRLKGWVHPWRELRAKTEELDELAELLAEEADDEYPLVLTTGRRRSTYHTGTQTGRVTGFDLHY